MRIVKTTKCKTVNSECRLYFHFKERTPRHLFKFITKDRSFIYLVNVLLPNFFANKRMYEVVSEKIEQKVFVCGLNLVNAYSSKFDSLKNFSDRALLKNLWHWKVSILPFKFFSTPSACYCAHLSYFLETYIVVNFEKSKKCLIVLFQKNIVIYSFHIIWIINMTKKLLFHYFVVSILNSSIVHTSFFCL